MFFMIYATICLAALAIVAAAVVLNREIGKRQEVEAGIDMPGAF
jgi:hypothetical protein